MKDLSLYVIIDEQYVYPSGAKGKRDTVFLHAQSGEENPLSAIVTEVCRAGATAIQLREKTREARGFMADAVTTREITARHNVLFIVNDRIDIAIASNADGVHLGQRDVPVRYARRMLGKRLIGASASTVEQALKAEEEGAAYLGVGSLFVSSTKKKPTITLSVFSEIKRATRIPVLGIGGITLDRVEGVLSAGADGVCVAGDVFNHPDIGKRVEGFASRIQRLKDSTQIATPACRPAGIRMIFTDLCSEYEETGEETT
jgi:thiamine-phosphate pyrophosphorylase